MSSTAVIAIVIAAVVVLAAIAFVTAARRGDVRRGAGSLSRETRRKDRSTARRRSEERRRHRPGGRAGGGRRAFHRPRAGRGPRRPRRGRPPDPETIGFTRRQFFNRSAVTLMGVGLVGLRRGLPSPSCGRSSAAGSAPRSTLGKVDDLNSQIEGAKNALYLAEARTWLVQYPKEALPKAQKVYTGAILTGMEAGFVALYQKCVHLGCRVPFCETSQWFECPCHGSQYNRVGEKKGGPAPRGLDRFAISVSGGNLVIDTGALSLGPPIGTNTTGQEAEGPHCITSAGGH